jgi:gamma-glutamyltranspeptidase/glutathione hydrolase
VAQAAREALARGNAVDAVVAGVLVAAAEAPTVLLGPLQVLVGGAGAGLLAIDGRVRQPGLGAPRPRGFLADEAVPDSARVGVPALPAALATTQATLGGGSLLRAAGPALERAKQRCAERAELLEAFARRGAAAFAEDAIAGELVAVAGRAARGLLTQEDIVALRPVVVRCDERVLDASGLLGVPWSESVVDASFTHVVAAADGRGLVAIACYEAPVEGLALPALGLAAPLCAEPVLRGRTRVRPAEPRPAAAPVALRARRGVVDLALGVALAADAQQSLDAVTHALETAPTIADAVAVAARGRPVALVRTRDAALVVASA